jgi:CubicO group peptidase (beta-lactamase class C family)
MHGGRLRAIGTGVNMKTRRLVSVTSMIAIAAVFPQPAIAQPRGSNPPDGFPAILKTRLEARTYSGGDLDSSFPWVRSVTIASGSPLYFRWRSSETGVTAAQWQVTDSPGGFTGNAGTIASGQRTAVPTAGQSLEFAIDFKQILPASPPNTPKDYYVRIVPRAGRTAFAPSAAVKVTHVKAGPYPVILDFDIRRFEQNLKKRLAGMVTGYSYAIYEYDVLKFAGAGGHAVLPNVLHSPDKRETALSMSKTITAAAVMKAMEEMRARGLSITIDSPIAPYLPSNWTLGPHVTEMTFRQLLTHKSGLRPAEVDPDSNDPDTFINLRQSIQYGATDENFASPEGFYANANFCLFRVIIPYMVSDREPLKMVEPMLATIAQTTGDIYVEYVQTHLLQPIGLSGISVVPTGPTPYTRYYNFANTSESFTDPTDGTARLRTGAGYWHMSAKEFGKFISSLRHHDKIISSESMKIMRDNNLGMYEAESPAGKSWEHNGGYQAGGAGSVSAWMAFSNGVTAVIFANSQGGLAEAPQEVVRNAFNQSW